MNIDPAFLSVTALGVLVVVFAGGLLGLHLKNRVNGLGRAYRFERSHRCRAPAAVSVVASTSPRLAPSVSAQSPVRAPATTRISVNTASTTPALTR